MHIPHRTSSALFLFNSFSLLTSAFLGHSVETFLCGMVYVHHPATSHMWQDANIKRGKFLNSPAETLAHLWIFCLHYNRWDKKFQINITQVSSNNFGLIFSHVLACRGKSLFWLLREIRISLTWIFFHFCNLYSPFNISGTLEEDSTLKFSDIMYRWWG